MALMTWSNSFSVHIRKIDEEHKKWIEFYNTLCHALSERKDAAVLGTILADLANYTIYHFDTEEELFRKYAYPEYERHKEEHEKMKQQIAEMHKNFIAGKLTLTTDVLILLKDWLCRHILGSDKRYTDFLNNQGVF